MQVSGDEHGLQKLPPAEQMASAKALKQERPIKRKVKASRVWEGRLKVDDVR